MGKAALVLVLVAGVSPAQPSADASADIHVPQDVATPQLAIEQAQPGDTIVLDAGTYPGGYVVPAGKHDITIAGVDRNTSAVGYSGTNSSGMVIRDSIWTGNGAGIVPNTYANEALPPETGTTIVLNVITRSGRDRVPIHTALAGFVGIGIAVAGGSGNVIRDNHVVGSERYGVAVFSTARYVTFNPSTREPGPPWRPRGNRVRSNVVTGSGWGDLALAAGSGPRNCFAANTVGTTLPARLQTGSCTTASPAGDRGVASVVMAPVQRMVEETARRRHPPSYRTLPPPTPQPDMG